jgi:hypothetical protein
MLKNLASRLKNGKFSFYVLFTFIFILSQILTIYFTVNSNSYQYVSFVIFSSVGIFVSFISAAIIQFSFQKKLGLTVVSLCLILPSLSFVCMNVGQSVMVVFHVIIIICSCVQLTYEFVYKKFIKNRHSTYETILTMDDVNRYINEEAQYSDGELFY